MEYKDTLKKMTKVEMLSEMFKAFTDVSTAYIEKKPIYSKIYVLRDILDVLLERCK